MKKIKAYALATVLAFGICFAGIGFAGDDPGPKEMVLSQLLGNKHKKGHLYLIEMTLFLFYKNFSVNQQYGG